MVVSNNLTSSNDIPEVVASAPFRRLSSYDVFAVKNNACTLSEQVGDVSHVCTPSEETGDLSRDLSILVVSDNLTSSNDIPEVVASAPCRRLSSYDVFELMRLA